MSEEIEPKTRTERIPRTPQQLFFVKRLRRMLALQRYCRTELSDNDPEMRLLRRGIYSTYVDCVNSGIGDEARHIIDERKISQVNKPTS